MLTADLRALMLGMDAEQFRLDADKAGHTVFPASAVRPMQGLLRA